jgi:hypothetical protein
MFSSLASALGLSPEHYSPTTSPSSETTSTPSLYSNSAENIFPDSSHSSETFQNQGRHPPLHTKTNTELTLIPLDFDDAEQDALMNTSGERHRSSPQSSTTRKVYGNLYSINDHDVRAYEKDGLNATDGEPLILSPSKSTFQQRHEESFWVKNQEWLSNQASTSSNVVFTVVFFGSYI